MKGTADLGDSCREPKHQLRLLPKLLEEKATLGCGQRFGYLKTLERNGRAKPHVLCLIHNTEPALGDHPFDTKIAGLRRSDDAEYVRGRHDTLLTITSPKPRELSIFTKSVSREESEDVRFPALRPATVIEAAAHRRAFAVGCAVGLSLVVDTKAQRNRLRERRVAHAEPSLDRGARDYAITRAVEHEPGRRRTPARPRSAGSVGSVRCERGNAIGRIMA